MMPHTQSTSDLRKQTLQETDDSESNIRDYCTTSLKHCLRMRADEAWNERNEELAIFYQTVSLGLQCTYFQDCENDDDIQSYIKQLHQEIRNAKDHDKPIHLTSFDDANKYLESEIAFTCHNTFPKDWTVIQLCKNCYPLALFSTHEEIMTHNAGLSITIFKHSAINDTLMVEVEVPTSLDNIYEKVFNLNKLITDNAQQNISTREQNLSTKEAREKYLQATQEIDVYVQDIINKLTSFLGPWICVLTGKFKSQRTLETENKIRAKVYEFIRTRPYLTEHQQKLIHLVARRTDLLSHQQIFVAITYILRDKPNLGYDDIDLNDLYDHLTWIKQQYKYDDTSTYPCILIVDELLDQMPFEMVNTQQEFTRSCSFANLKRLYLEHSASFDYSGHLVHPPQHCQAIVNPTKDLDSMEERMKLFFNYWLPTWKVLYSEENNETTEILSKCDVFVYCGHGSGVQAISDNVYKLKTRSVMFLFGCASVGLASSGLGSELSGAHTYYHLGSSPCVIGFLWTVTDFSTDLCATRLLSAWMQSNAKPHWQLIDKQQWRKFGKLVFNRVRETISSPNLPEVVTKMRSDMDLPVALRASLVYRGLPLTRAFKSPKSN